MQTEAVQQADVAFAYDGCCNIALRTQISDSERTFSFDYCRLSR